MIGCARSANMSLRGCNGIKAFATMKDRIEQSIDWLCENGSPPVNYLIHRDILGASSRTKRMKELWRSVQKCDDATEMFSKQRRDGSWYSGGSWATKPTYIQKGGYTPYSPKYATTIWVLVLLGDMGLDISDPRIRKACEFTMGFQQRDGTFGSFGKSCSRRKRTPDEPRNIPCHFAGYLTGLAKVGMGADPRLDKSYELLYRWQLDDGGWLNERHTTAKASPYKVWTRGCPFVTYFACQALRHSGRGDAREPYRRGLNFLAKHLARKRPEELRRFFYHGHEILKELVMFSEEGTAVPKKVMKTLLGWLAGIYDSESGHYRYGGKPISKMSRRIDGHTPRELKYRLYHPIEDDWLTYYVTKILSNLQSTD